MTGSLNHLDVVVTYFHLGMCVREYECFTYLITLSFINLAILFFFLFFFNSFDR